MNSGDTLRAVLEPMSSLQLAVLFGSAAIGGARRGGDLDIGVLLDPAADRSPLLCVALERAAGRRVDLVWLDEAPPLLRFEIARTGRLLVERVPHGWTDFRAHAMIDWWDWAPTARIMHAAMTKRLREEADRRELVAAKAGRARAWLNDSAGALSGSIDLFLSDSKTRDLSLFYLFLAIQECIDLAAHWVADEGWGQPDDAGSAYDVLADRQVIDRDTATALRAAAGLRNRIAPGDAPLDYTRVRAFLVAITEAAGLESDSVRAPVDP